MAKTDTGPALANERFAARVTQLRMARELGINRSSLSLIENGWKALPEGFASQYREALRRLTEVAA